MTMDHKHLPNSLIHSASPYLKQHAYNPVDWKEWNRQTLDLANAENKPLLISIGYSACHWCHVMAHESFEDEQTAALMNQHFINVKIDREERPDIDQIYMDAIQLLTGRGGWPLNVFALPGGKPFYGGTYFRREDWKNVLSQISEMWYKEPEKIFAYADNLSNGVLQSNAVKEGEGQWTENDFHLAINQMRQTFDTVHGGLNRAPKFPLPVLYHWALHYQHLFPNAGILQWVSNSVKKMSLGGLYDTLAGGYARYSVDALWKVPHFEKMLYDNGQMLSVLAKTYMVTGEAFLLEKMRETHAFLKNNWQTEDGGLFSAWDADSEGVEGKYYVFTFDEVQELKGASDQVLAYFHITRHGNWEEGKNILFATETPHEFAAALKLDSGIFTAELEQFTQELLKLRNQRVKPGLDDKIICSWNALAATGLLHCYQATGQTEFKDTAIRILSFIESKLWNQGILYRNYRPDGRSIPGFLEDYVYFAEALTTAYQCTFEPPYLTLANRLIETVLNQFHQSDSPFMVFNPDAEGELYYKKTDLGDDVIPSANAVLCELLLVHGFYFNRPEWSEKAAAMLYSVRNQAVSNPAWHCRWLSVALLQQQGINQLTYVGDGLKSLLGNYLPHTIVCQPSPDIPLTASKSDASAGYYLCRNYECFEPETDFDKVWSRLF